MSKELKIPEDAAYREILEKARGLQSEMDEVIAERDALAAQLAELKGQEPVAWVRQEDLDDQNDCLFVSRYEYQKTGYAIPLYTKPVVPVQQATLVGWSGWAIQYPGKMPTLFGAREIAELNWYPEEGADLIRVVEVDRIASAPQPVAQEGEGDE